MINFLPDPRDHVIAFRANGRMEAGDMDRAISAFEQKLAQHERVSFFADLEALEGFSARAFLRDLRYGFSQIGNLHRFYRAAVVTDKGWIRTAAEWEDRLFPQVEVRAFAPEEREAALAWASSELPAEPSQGEAPGSAGRRRH